MAMYVLVLGLLTMQGTLAISDYLSDARQEHRKCEPITIPMCKNIGYNMTSMPNPFNHQRQDEAGLEVHQFWPLVEVSCSVHLKFFLCSRYVPICLPDYNQPLPPCRSICQAAKQGCAPLMLKYGFEWPSNLDCDKLPEYAPESGSLCMQPPEHDKKVTDKPETNPDWDIKHKPNPDYFPIDERVSPPPRVPTDPHSCQCVCKAPFVILRPGEFNDKVRVANMSHCAYPCYTPYLEGRDSDRQNLLTFWIGFWAVSCCIITFLMLVTFLIDIERFKYPERPIFFLAACYFMISLGYIIRLAVGHENVACDGNIVRSSTSDPPVCTLVFLLIYFFGMSSSVWWVVISLTWFLAAGLKWSNEAIQGYASIFHVFAWVLPAIKTAIILLLTAVDGDPIAGICYVGNTNVDMLRAFVLGPLCAYLVLGICFLAAGFASLVRIRKVVKAAGVPKIEKLERLMIRIGIFSVLYTIPATIVICCLFYEQHYRPQWEVSSTCSPSCFHGDAPPAVDDQQVFALALIKYCMSLVVGATSGLWIWSPKTLASWRQFCLRVFCCQNPRTRTYAGAAYHPAEAIIIKSHTDISSQAAYSGANIVRHGIYPMNHV